MIQRLNSPDDAVEWLRSRVTGTLQTDSRLVAPGDGFIAWPGAATDGRAHVADARKRIVRLSYNYEERPTSSADTDALSETGLLFGSWQADVTEQFVPIQRALDEADLLNVWTTPIGSAVFAIPPGCRGGEYVGQALLEG